MQKETNLRSCAIKSNQIKNFINVSEIFSLQAANWGHIKDEFP